MALLVIQIVIGVACILGFIYLINTMP